MEDKLGGPHPRLVLGGEAHGGGEQAAPQRGRGGGLGAGRQRQRHHAHAQRGPAPFRLNPAVGYTTLRQLLWITDYGLHPRI